MDRFDDMRARGGAGGAGGGVSVDGTETSILMNADITAGQRFVAEKNEGKSPFIATIAQTITQYCASRDGSVFMDSSGLNKTAKTLNVYCKNEDGVTYGAITVDIPEGFEEACTLAEQSGISSSTFCTNEDGTLIWGGYGGSTSYANRTPFVLVIEIDKETRTGNAKLFVNPFDGGDSRVYTKLGGFMYACGEYLIGQINFYQTSNQYRIRIFKYTGNSIEEVADISSSQNMQPDWCLLKGKYLYGHNAFYGQMKKINLNTGNVDMETSIRINNNGKYSTITEDGLLALNYSKTTQVHQLNFDNLTVNKIFEITTDTQGYAYADESGNYVYTNSGIYDITTKQKVLTNTTGTSKLPSAFDSKNGWLQTISSKPGLYKIVAPEEGEYLATPCSNMTVENGKVYGVALEDINGGSVGAGKIMFLGQPETTT